MITHPYEEQLSAYMDGRLDVAQTHDVAKHLSACASCQRALEGLQTTKALLRGLEAPSVPEPEFWTNVYRRLRVEGTTVKAPSPWETLRMALDGEGGSEPDSCMRGCAELLLPKVGGGAVGDLMTATGGSTRLAIEGEALARLVICEGARGEPSGPVP